MPKTRPVKTFYFDLNKKKAKLKGKQKKIEKLKEKEASLLENDFFIKISSRNPLLTKEQVHEIKNKYIEEYDKSKDVCIDDMKKSVDGLVNEAYSLFYPKKRSVYEGIKDFMEDNFLSNFNAKLKELRYTFLDTLNRIENDLLTVNKRSEYLRGKVNDMELTSNSLQFKMKDSLLHNMTAGDIEKLKNNIIIEYNRKFYHIKIFLRDNFMKMGEESLPQFPSFKLIRGMPIKLLESNLDRHFIFLNEYLELARILEMKKEMFFKGIAKLTPNLNKDKEDKNNAEKSKKSNHLKYHYKKACILNYQNRAKKNILKP